MASSTLIVVADTLTLTRLAIAIVLIPAVWAENLTLSAILLSLAWLSDLFDGRLARAGEGAGKLHAWDLRADTAVGVGLLIGVVGSGLAPVWLAIAGAGFLWGYLSGGNIAAAMLLQLCGFVPLLILLWARRPIGWWMPFLAAALIAVIDWHRLVKVNIPAFINGLRRP